MEEKFTVNVFLQIIQRLQPAPNSFVIQYVDFRSLVPFKATSQVRSIMKSVSLLLLLGCLKLLGLSMLISPQKGKHGGQLLELGVDITLFFT